MDRIIKINVAGNHLTKDSRNAGTRGEANVTILRITFDEGWDEFDKKITFWDARGLNPVEIYLLPTLAESKRVYRVPIPGEPMEEAGELTFVIEGSLDDKVQRSLSGQLEVEDAPIADNAGEPVPPTEDELAQVRHSLDEIKADIIEVRDAKDSVGKTSYIGENGNWYAWNIKAKEFYDTGICASGNSYTREEIDAMFLERRTHYVEGKVYGEVHWTKEETANGDGKMSVLLSEPLEEGVEYPYEASWGSGTFMLQPQGDFTYVDFGLNGGTYNGDNIILNIGYNTEGFIRIGQLVYHPLDEGFIPDTIARKSDLNNVATPDWSQNDETQAGYVKNRTHYDTRILLGESTSEDGQMSLSEPFSEGNSYVLEVDGKAEEVLVGGNSDGTWSIFVASIINQEIMYGWTGDSVLNVQTTSEPHSYKLYRADAVTLPERFIPEGIARKRDVVHNLKDGENGSVYMTDSVAQAEDSVMLGKSGVAGVKAYYIKSIDFENKKIYLTKTQPVIPSLTEHEADPSILDDEEFYEVGDTFSIISEFHYPACGTIAEIDENRVITYAEDLPFTEVYEDANYDGNTFNVAEKPFVGCVTLGLRGFGAGTGNTVGGESGTALGRGGVVLDAYGTVIGYYNRAGYAAIALNALTEALGQHSLTMGQRTKTTAKAKNGVAGGFNTVSNAENQVVFGTFNIIDEEGNLVFILGNGKSDVARSNAFTVDKDGNVWLAGVVRSDKDGICLESDIIKLGSSTTNSIKAEKGICIGNVNNILATAKQSVQIGDGNTAAGEKTMQIGTSNRAPTTNGYVYQIGYANVSNFGQAYMLGKLLEAGEYEQVIQGRYNKAVSDAIYVLGNGTTSNRKNALVIKKSTDDAMFEGDVYSKGKKVATQTEIDALNTKIKAFENEKVVLNDSIAGLYSEITSLTERIASLESKLN